MISTMAIAGQTLEAAGAGILMKSSLLAIGQSLTACGEQLSALSSSILSLQSSSSSSSSPPPPSTPPASAATQQQQYLNAQVLSSQRMQYAAEKMMEAGSELMKTSGITGKDKAKGKGWLKG
jgi:hypothetical protein